MNLEQLIAFDRIVREGSFSRAAWVLQIAQPTISARLKALEKTVGGPLFTRNNRAVILTERGNRFLPFARQALEALQKGIDAADHGLDEAQPDLHVGVLRSIAGGFVAPALQHLLKNHPTTQCTMKEGSHWQLVERLHDAELELAVITWPPVGPHLAEMTPLLHFREPMVLLAHQSHPLANMVQVTRSDVEQLSNPFLLISLWQVTPDSVDQMAQRAKNMIEVPTDSGRYLIANGTGAGFFNQSQITPELIPSDVVEIKIVDLPKLYRHSALVRLSRRSTLSAAATHFLESLEIQAKRLGFLG